MHTLNPHQTAARVRARRIRRIASVALALIVIGAGIRYVLQTRGAGPTAEDLMPGTAAARSRATAILIGSFGESLVEVWRFVQEPASQAVIVIVTAVAGTLLCFRIATLIERYADQDGLQR